MSSKRRLPTVVILDPSIGVTGALMSARRQAQTLSDVARFVLVIPIENELSGAELTEFDRVLRLPLASLRRDIRSMVRYPFALIRTGRALARLLADENAANLQVNDFYLPHGWIARRYGFCGRIVTWVRIDPRRFGIVGKWWMGRAAASSDAIVAVSEHVRRLIPAALDPYVIYDPASVVRTTFPSGQRFLFLGNYTEGKGQEVAIAAFHSIAARYPLARLDFYGSDFGLPRNRAFRKRLLDLANEGAGRGRITVGDFVQDVEPLYNEALAALNCSESESFSRTCLDASAHGLPVIATRCGGPEEIIDHGRSGILVEIGDVNAIASAMAYLLDNPEDAVAMGLRGRSLMTQRFGEDTFRLAIRRVLEI